MRERGNLQPSGSRLLKKDTFGTIEIVDRGAERVVRRNAAAAKPALRWLARRLLAREANALAALQHVDGVPDILRVSRHTLEREYIEGEPMQASRPTDPGYFRAAARLLRIVHRAGVTHNDLAKEPNFLVTAEGKPALIDFQLATCSPRRGALFRILGREDIRHLLKHKRTYCPDQLTERERKILASPSWLSRTWMKTGKPVYLFVTRRILGWEDREGAGDRV